MSDEISIGFDRPLTFTIPARHVRGRFVRLGPVLDTILSAHRYPPAAERLLAEALVLTALLGSTLKDAEGQLTMQAQTGGGPVELLVADYKGGALRGYLKFDAEALAMAGPDPSLFALFGQGFLAITFDMATSGERYQGIVPLEGEGLADAAAHYFEQSEQIPSFLRVGVRHEKGAGCIAGGVLVQHLPEGEVGRDRLHVRHDHPEWEHALAIVQTLSTDELTDPALGLDTLAWRLFHEEEVRVDLGAGLTRGCRCSTEHFESVLRQFPDADRADMADDRGVIAVDCAFCSRIFPIEAARLAVH